MPDFVDLLRRSEHVKDLLIDGSLALARAADWGQRGNFIGLLSLPVGHWYARKARARYVAAVTELQQVREELDAKVPDVEVPAVIDVLGEELAIWVGLRHRLGDTASKTSVAVGPRWEWPLLPRVTTVEQTFANRMATSRLELDSLIEAVGELLARLRKQVTQRAA